MTASTALAPERVARPHGYEHLAPLFVERDGLPPADPRRNQLRDKLIAGYRPVAQHIAHRHGYRGEPADDLEHSCPPRYSIYPLRIATEAPNHQ